LPEIEPQFSSLKTVPIFIAIMLLIYLFIYLFGSIPDHLNDVNDMFTLLKAFLKSVKAICVSKLNSICKNHLILHLLFYYTF
jgi:hypothetical protein